MIGTLAVVGMLLGWAGLGYWQHTAKRDYRPRHAAPEPEPAVDLEPAWSHEDEPPIPLLTHQVSRGVYLASEGYPSGSVPRERMAPPPVQAQSAMSASQFAAQLDDALDRAGAGADPTTAWQLYREDDGGGRHRIETRKGIVMAECGNCGGEVLIVQSPGGDVVLDSTPDPQRGQVIVLGDQCRFVTTPEDWAAVRAHNLPVYRRHNTHCPGFWIGRTRHLLREGKLTNE